MDLLFINLFLVHFSHFRNSFNFEIMKNSPFAHCEIATTTCVKASQFENSGPISDACLRAYSAVWPPCDILK